MSCYLSLEADIVKYNCLTKLPPHLNRSQLRGSCLCLNFITANKVFSILKLQHNILCPGYKCRLFTVVKKNERFPWHPKCAFWPPVFNFDNNFSFWHPIFHFDLQFSILTPNILFCPHSPSFHFDTQFSILTPYLFGRIFSISIYKWSYGPYLQNPGRKHCCRII